MDNEMVRQLLSEARQKVKDGRLAVEALAGLTEAKGRAFYQAVILAQGDLNNEYVRECRDDLMKVTTEVREAIATDEARTEMIELILARFGDE